jgi:hypothetical protein
VSGRDLSRRLVRVRVRLVTRIPVAEVERRLVARFMRAVELVLGHTLESRRPPGRIGKLDRSNEEVAMKGASKPKKLAKKVAQKSLKEKRSEKRAAGTKKYES